MGKAGLSLNQVKRELHRLRVDGMILSERHKFAGNEVREYIQPTALALSYLGRPGDVARLAKVYVPAN